ncbi:MAG: major tail protein [Intestinibacter sp.]|uniref:major tail protein n=1 Tax=Intestinibacter sp. TaxID=1965304 RepID=UPI003F15DFF9
MKKTKACVGLSNIHFAPFNGSTFESPVRIFHAKKIENKFKYENIQEWADNIAVINEFLYGGGEGSLTVLGLSKEERVLLFGNKAVKGGIVVSDTDEAPIGAFLFERRLTGGARRLYVVYACKCSPTDISGETIEEGKGNYETNDIEYSISSCEHEGVNLVYFYIDTNDETVNQEQVTNWYKSVQFPQDLEDARALKAKKIDVEINNTEK